MTRVVKQFGVFLTLLVLLLAFRFLSGGYGPFLYDQIVKAAQESHVPLELEGFECHFIFRCSFSSVGAVLPLRGFPLPLSLQNGEIDWKTLALLGGRVKVAANADGYDGKLKFVVSRGMSSADGEASIESIEIGKHPVGNGFQASGRVSAKAVLGADGNGRVGAKGADLAYAGNNTIAGIFKVPTFSEGTLDAEATLKGAAFVIEKFRFSSSLGDIRAEGKGTLAKQQIESGEFAVSIELTGDGKKALGGWLALQARTNIERPAANWEVGVKIERGRPVVKVAAR